ATAAADTRGDAKGRRLGFVSGRIAGALVLALAVLLSLAFAQAGRADTGVRCAPTGNEVVATDDTAYSPGSLVHVTGMGYSPGCDIVVKVTRPDGSVITGDGSNTAGSDTVTTDLFGGFSYDYQLQATPALERTYSVDVLGASDAVLASTTFEDAPKIQFIAAPTPILSSSGRVVALEVTNTGGSAFNTNHVDNIRCVKATFPAGFLPTSVVGVGTTRSGQSWTASISGQVVTATATNASNDQLYKDEALSI